jgi:hypothetical protein
VVNAATKGVIFPTFANSIVSSFKGADPKLSGLALQTFMQYQLTEASVAGQTIQHDLMRKSLSPIDYGMMNAAKFAVDGMGLTPAEFSIRQQNYAREIGNVLDDVKGDLNINKNQSISTALDLLGMNISPRYKSELQGAIIARKILGNPVTEENLEDFVDEYTESMNMVADEFVYAPSIDGKSMYARPLHMTDNDMNEMREQVITAITGAPEYQRLFTGGTFLDAAVEIFMQAIPARNAYAMLTEQEDTILAMNTDREKIMKMMEVIGVDIHYQPVIESFQNDQPSYRAGYITDSGMFEAFTLNGEPVIVSPPVMDERKSELLNSAVNLKFRILASYGGDYKRIANSETRVALAQQEVLIQRLKGAEQTLEDFQANTQLFDELNDILDGTGVTLEELINGN